MCVTRCARGLQRAMYLNLTSTYVTSKFSHQRSRIDVPTSKFSRQYSYINVLKSTFTTTFSRQGQRVPFRMNSRTTFLDLAISLSELLYSGARTQWPRNPHHRQTKMRLRRKMQFCCAMPTNPRELHPLLVINVRVLMCRSVSRCDGDVKAPL